MSTQKYKYTTEDFKSFQSISEELGEFYVLFEQYKKSNDDGDKFILEDKMNDLYFAIKRAKLHETINVEVVDDMWEYVGGLVYDRL